MKDLPASVCPSCQNDRLCCTCSKKPEPTEIFCKKCGSHISLFCEKDVKERMDTKNKELQAENKVKDKILECASYLLNRGQTIQPDSALHGDIEQALKGSS